MHTLFLGAKAPLELVQVINSFSIQKVSNSNNLLSGVFGWCGGGFGCFWVCLVFLGVFGCFGCFCMFLGVLGCFWVISGLFR